MTAIAGKTILLMGGAGFISTTLCERLVENNRLRLLDTLHRDALSKTSLGAHPNVELIVGDVQDAALVTRVMQGCQWVVHLASIAGVDTVMRLPVQTMTVALRGTMNVLDAALAIQYGGGYEKLAAILNDADRHWPVPHRAGPDAQRLHKIARAIVDPRYREALTGH